MTLQTAAMETPMPAALALTEQVVLVTGGARGLGAAISRAFLREGARVVVNYHRRRAAALSLPQEVGTESTLALQDDVTDLHPAAASVKPKDPLIRKQCGSMGRYRCADV